MSPETPPETPVGIPENVKYFTHLLTQALMADPQARWDTYPNTGIASDALAAFIKEELEDFQESMGTQMEDQDVEEWFTANPNPHLVFYGFFEDYLLETVYSKRITVLPGPGSHTSFRINSIKNAPLYHGYVQKWPQSRAEYFILKAYPESAAPYEVCAVAQLGLPNIGSLGSHHTVVYEELGITKERAIELTLDFLGKTHFPRM